MNAPLLPSSSSARRILALAALGVALAGAAACGSTVDHTEAAASPDKAASPQAAHVGGVVGAFLEAAQGLNLRPDQRAVLDAARANVEQQTAPVREAHARLAAEVAAEVRAGQLDHAKLKPLAEQVADAAARTKPAVQDAVQKVHDALDASQRKALVAALRDRASQHAGLREMRGHMQQMATELALTDAQRATIHDQMKAAFAGHADEARAEHAQHKGRLETIATAFEADAFDAKALDVGGQAANGARRTMGLHGMFLDAAVPLLTPAQREKLATRIQQRAQALED